MTDRSPDSVTRKPHAALARASREKKARKIQNLLTPRLELRGARVLEVGTGSGYVASYLGRLVGEAGSVSAVDVLDQRQVEEGYDFQRVEGTDLPFQNDVFDLVVSNHVIEHVGDQISQQIHLKEIGRVLGPGGLLYLAVPNRWTFVEPHFRLAFLSWLPRPFRSPYVRLFGRGEHYDCEPPSRSEMVRLFRRAGYSFEDISAEGIRELARIECESIFLRQFLQGLSYLLPIYRIFLPSFLFVARPVAAKSH